MPVATENVADETLPDADSDTRTDAEDESLDGQLVLPSSPVIVFGRWRQ